MRVATATRGRRTPRGTDPLEVLLVNGWLVRTLGVALFAMIPVQAIRPLVTYRALELGATPFDLGVVAGAYALLSFIFAAPLGRWMDRFGEAPFLILGSGIIAATALGLAAVGNLPMLVLSQAVLGLGQVAMLLSVQTLVANGGPKEGRDARFGHFTVIGSVAQMVGPVIGGFLFGTAGLGLGAIFALSMAPALVALGLSVSLQVRPPERLRTRDLRQLPRQDPFLRSVGTVLRQPSVPHAMLASLTVLTTIDLLTAYLPAYGEANAIPASTIGLLLGIRAAASMASRLMLGPIMRRSTRRRVLVQSMVLPAVALGVLPLTTNTAVLVVLMAASGYGLGLGQPLSMSWITDAVPRTIRATALGVRITGNRLAQFGVPLAVGAVAGATGIGAIFVTSAVMLGASSVAVARAPSDG
jgi:MFS family permease